jgi:hypothetical protein
MVESTYVANVLAEGTAPSMNQSLPEGFWTSHIDCVGLDVNGAAQRKHG